MVSFSVDWEGFSLLLRFEAAPKPKGMIINTYRSNCYHLMMTNLFSLLLLLNR
ncbi:unknown protein [Microcystis aeruginosa NIES-843]|uniref:Uncharacterized protein n=1 Tax=Microcystis aeruginosa (strain NIES-843 / IAM M-2473) TaxID=449447 RepID=B0JRS0_MICAN|nr:unknown protein [Microcystis aeruginosa NIES-843]